MVLNDSKELLDEMSAAIARACKFTYPLLREPIGGQTLEQFASCFFIHIDGNDYLVSAGHALRTFESEKYHLLTRNSSKVLKIAANIVSTALDDKGQDHLDMAVVKLDGGFCSMYGINVIAPPMFIDSSRDVHAWKRILSGYPVRRNKKVLSKSNRLHLHGQYYVDLANDNDQAVKFGEFRKRTEDHVVIQLQDGISNRGAYQNVPVNPQGMSGGPMWRVSSRAGSPDILIEAVFIEMHNRANRYFGFATKLHHLIGFIRQVMGKPVSASQSGDA